jgi:hypothetical protein
VTKKTRIKNLVDLVFFANRELDGWWKRRAPIGDSREMMRLKKEDMKDIMNTEVGW